MLLCEFGDHGLGVVGQEAVAAVRGGHAAVAGEGFAAGIQHHLSGNGIGLTGVGAELLEELFTLPVGLDPALEAAIEEFTAGKRAKEKKLKALEVKAAMGGVRGRTAAQEIRILESGDTTEMNRIEITLAAAKRRAGKNSGEVALQKQKAAQEAAEKKKKADSRSALKARMAMFEKR